MSVHFWGEPVLSPTYGGVWSLTLNNAGNRPCILNDWGMTFYGTRLDPQPGVSIRPVFMVIFVYTVGQLKSEKNRYRHAQPIVRLHCRVICHMNGNFVGFQNMSDFKISDL